LDASRIIKYFSPIRQQGKMIVAKSGFNCVANRRGGHGKKMAGKKMETPVEPWSESDSDRFAD
jgi:hypothetical protein